jgi:serine/threonine protein kinase
MSLPAANRSSRKVAYYSSVRRKTDKRRSSDGDGGSSEGSRSIISRSLAEGSESFDQDNHTLDFRLGFVRNILKTNKIEGLIADASSEDVLTHHEHDDQEGECQDIKCVLRKHLMNFEKTILTLGETLDYIKSGTTGHIFKCTNAKLGLCYAVKVVAYPNRSHYGDPNIMDRPENAELLMLKVLSQFVICNKTPHIVLPIGVFDTSLKSIMDVTSEKVVGSSRYNEFVERYNNGYFYQQASVLISEWADKGDLLDYIRKNYKIMSLMDWKVIFFQQISVLAVIHRKYEDFRHNDAKANNWMVQSSAASTNSYRTYNIGEKYYVVPSIGLIVKLWDFDFSCIPGLIGNSKVDAEWTNDINVKASKNQYYDLHYFFNSLGREEFFPQFWTSRSIPREVKDFAETVVPVRYRENTKYVTKSGRITTDEEVWTPKRLLEEHPFFDEFRHSKSEYVNWKRDMLAKSEQKEDLAKERQKNGISAPKRIREL